MRLTAFRPAVFGCAALLQACAALSSPATALVNGALAACPSAPHCVSSLAADERHAIAAFQLADAEHGWNRVIETVRGLERTTVVASDARYLHAEVVSPWHFYTDDLELLRRDDGRIDVRSSSRVGYYDFQVNRKRVDALRRRLQDAGILRAPGAGTP